MVPSQAVQNVIQLYDDALDDAVLFWKEQVNLEHGVFLEAREEIDKLHRDVLHKEGRISELDGRISELDGRISELQHIIGQKNRYIRSLESGRN